MATGPWSADAQARSGLPVPLAMDMPDGFEASGWLASEKFDGVRAVWDGQRLRFRSGLPIAAPEAFVARLPLVALDGELWLGRGRFEALSGLVRRDSPDPQAWQAVQYLVFDSPQGPARFADRLLGLQRAVAAQRWPALQVVAQQVVRDPADLRQRLQAVLAAGGEGLMLRHPDASYAAGRTPWLRKLKPLSDAEAQVIGHWPGQGRHAGRLGALQVRTPEGLRFRIGTGLSDAQRDRPPALGSWITYTYRGTTASGVPRFASFLRVRPPGL